MKTKKILFAIAFGAVTFLSSYIFTHNNNEIKLSDLALANVEALASAAHGAGGVPKTTCPIWNVQYEQGWTGPIITCNTGGVYKCAAGLCPHEQGSIQE